MTASVKLDTYIQLDKDNDGQLQFVQARLEEAKAAGLESWLVDRRWYVGMRWTDNYLQGSPSLYERYNALLQVVRAYLAQYRPDEGALMSLFYEENARYLKAQITVFLTPVTASCLDLNSSTRTLFWSCDPGIHQLLEQMLQFRR